MIINNLIIMLKIVERIPMRFGDIIFDKVGDFTYGNKPGDDLK